MPHATTLRTPTSLRTTLILASLLAGAGLTALVTAGPLDPPAGPITPAYKTLDQVEPRIPISLATTPGDSDSVYRITQPGSYYLTGNVQGQNAKTGIEVAASGVTIDLSGYSMIGTPSSQAAIALGVVVTNLVVRNGIIQGWSASGIDAFSANGSTYENLVLQSNTLSGLVAGQDCVIRNCQLLANGSGGLYCYSSCLISDTLATDNGGDGFDVSNGTTLSRCSAVSNTGDGVKTADNVQIDGCNFSNSGAYGVRASWRCTITNCHVFANALHGVSAGNQSRVVSNNIESNGNAGVGYGVYVDAASQSVTISDNSITGNDVGVKLDGPNNLVVRNFVRANTTNISAAGGNIVGPIVNAANIATQTNPSANYSN